MPGSSLKTSTGSRIFRWLPNATGIFSGLRILWIVIPLTGGMTAAGFWTGMEWCKGQHAIGEVVALGQQLDRLDAALIRNDEASRRFEQSQVAISDHYQNYTAEFQQWALENRPRLDGCVIGVDGLRLWNLWNQGPTESNDSG